MSRTTENVGRVGVGIGEATEKSAETFGKTVGLVSKRAGVAIESAGEKAGKVEKAAGSKMYKVADKIEGKK